MAEIVGLAASIIAIAGAADTALRMSKSVRQLARGLRAAKKDIRRFAKDIEAFSSIIDAAHYSLSTHSKVPQSQTKVLVFIHKRKLLNKLVEQSDSVTDHIGEIRPRLQLIKSNISFIERWKWILCRKEVKALGPRMESVKTSLNLVISLVMYEAVMQSIRHQVNSQVNSDVAARELRRLRRDMKRLTQQMVELQEQQRSPSQDWESPENTFVDVQMEIQEALVELRETIVVENDIIPDVEHSSTSSRTMGRNRDSYAVPIVTERRRNSRVSSPRPLRHRRSRIRSQTIPPMAERAPTPVHTEVIIRHNSEEDLSGEESEESESIEVRQLPVETSNTDPGEGPSTLIVEESPKSSVSTREYADGDFISVQKTSSHIQYNPAIPRESISGYIATSNGAVQTTALLDRNLAENIISLVLVTKLGLQLYDSDEDKDWKWIYIGNAPGKRSRGRVVLRWSQGAFLSHKPLNIHCWVYEDDRDHRVRDLVFGKPFVHKRRHYWEGTEVEEG